MQDQYCFKSKFFKLIKYLKTVMELGEGLYFSGSVPQKAIIWE